MPIDLQQTGAKAKCLLDFEADFGTLIDGTYTTSQAVQFPFKTLSLNQSRNQIVSEVIDGSRQPVQPIIGNKVVQGDAVVPLDVNTIGFWLSACFGFPTTTTGGKASATIKITNYENLIGDTVTLDGNTFTGAAVDDTNDFVADTDNATTATNLAAKLDGISGFSAAAVNDVVTVEFDTEGVAGNAKALSYTNNGGGVGIVISSDTLRGGVETTKKKHVFKITDDVIPSMAIEKQFPDVTSSNKYALYSGVRVGSFALTAGGEGEIDVTFNLTGQKEVVGSSSIKASPNKYALDKYNQFQADLKEAGTTLAKATEVSMTYENGLTTDQYTIGGGGQLYDIPQGRATLSGNIKSLFTDFDLIDKAQNSESTSIILTYSKGTDYIEFNVPELLMSENTPGIDGPGGILVDMPYGAFLSASAEDSALTITIVNDVSNYNLRSIGLL